jgi:hypothetical protein
LNPSLLSPIDVEIRGFLPSIPDIAPSVIEKMLAEEGWLNV